MSKVQEVIDLVKGLTVLELAELVKALEEEFGVSAAAPVAVAAAPAAGAAAAEPVEEQTEFDVNNYRNRRQEGQRNQGGKRVNSSGAERSQGPR
jgi:ribosomal protein L7/L12